jgi:predicted branched-subunit amino acid permease
MSQGSPASAGPVGSRSTVLDGMRRGAPAAVASFAVGVTFGVLARPVIGAMAAIVMSFVVFAGSAQLAAVSTLGAGGAASAAVTAGLLMNVRFVPMGIAVGPSLPGGRFRRAAKGLAVVDASWALAREEGGRFDWPTLLGATIVQAMAWWSGTVLGVLGGGVLGDPRTLGLDAIFPAFFLALLADDLRQPRNAVVAAVAAVVALALTPYLPPGLPVTLASAAALIGLATRPSATGQHVDEEVT